MSEPLSDKPAFARACANYKASNQRMVSLSQDGLTFREYAVIELAKGITANPATNPLDIQFGKVANNARKLADAIFKDLKENP